ncbi:MAG: LysR family transcriptional regulator [Clostridia bacterium]|nr:LysR family transcriptional regulator [Clostridia bacterium]
MFSKYNYVYQVYKAQSFTKAAEKLFISQPSLSVAIKNIEKRLGADLFERTGSRVVPTEVGKEYIYAAERIMAVEKEFSDRINDLYHLETGKMTVGGTNYLSSYVLPRIINRFASLYPKIEVELVEANSGMLSHMVKNEQVDIIIDSFDETMDEYEGESLAKEEILLCVPKDRAVNRSLEAYQISYQSLMSGGVDFEKVPTVSMGKFKEEKFILLKPGNDMHNRAKTIFEKSKIEPKVAFYVDQMNISYALAESGMGLCFATDTLLKYGKFRDNVFVYKVDNKHSNRTLYIAHKKNKYCTRAMDAFIRIAKEVIDVG